MTVQQKLDKYKGKSIKLGSDTAFIYCGIADDNVLPVLMEESKKQLAKVKREYDNALRSKKNYIRRWKDRLDRRLEDFDNKAVKERWDHNTKRKKFRKLCEKYDNAKEQEKTKLDKKLISLPEKIDNWIDIPDRKVMETYRGIYGDIIILFEGEEKGEYWDAAEYNKRTIQ